MKFIDLGNGLTVFPVISKTQRTVGPNEHRECVLAEIYDTANNLVSSGISICHPTDSFNAAIGARRALAAATAYMRKCDRKLIQDSISAWML